MTQIRTVQIGSHSFAQGILIPSSSVADQTWEKFNSIDRHAYNRHPFIKVEEADWIKCDKCGKTGGHFASFDTSEYEYESIYLCPDCLESLAAAVRAWKEPLHDRQ